MKPMRIMAVGIKYRVFRQRSHINKNRIGRRSTSVIELFVLALLEICRSLFLIIILRALPSLALGILIEQYRAIIIDCLWCTG